MSLDGVRPHGVRPHRAWRVALAVGLCLIGASVALVLFNVWTSERAGQAAREALARLDAVIEERAQSEGEGAALLVWTLGQEMPTAEVDGRAYLGIVSVPELDVELAVTSSWSSEALGSCACRYSGSYYTDDLVVGGSSYASHFGPLLGAAIGADVYLTNVDGRRIHYVVANRETLRASEIDAMVANDQNSASATHWDLTLFTCDLDGLTRCAVRCVRE